MSHNDSGAPEDMNRTPAEDSLRAEIESLKRKLEEQSRLIERHEVRAKEPPPPSRHTLWMIALTCAFAVTAAFVTGYVPFRRRESMLVAEAKAQTRALPTVNVVAVERAPGTAELVLPGSIQAITEAPVLSRASGYIQRRYADIGDRVQAGQALADIDAPELDQQVRQATAAHEQSGAALDQALANLQQGRTNEELARVTAARWSNLTIRGAVSRQENDQYQAQYKAQQANVEALEKAVAAAGSNVAAAQANLARLSELQSYEKVRAPFAGVITLRNVDVGALVNEGSTLLFRIAQTNVLRAYVNVPQADSQSIHAGQPARLFLPDMPGREFTGTVTRTANALDPSTRTLLTEVQAPNPRGTLLPGMYAQVDLSAPQGGAQLLIPGDTLVVRSNGPQVAVVGEDHVAHFRRIQLGRDFGEKLEVLSGLDPGERIVVNPGDSVREGAKVNPVMLREKPGMRSGSSGGAR